MSATIIKFPRSRLSEQDRAPDPASMHWFSAVLWAAIVWVSVACAAVLAGAPVLTAALLLPIAVSVSVVALLTWRMPS
jgi:hypothetical protein